LLAINLCADIKRRHTMDKTIYTKTYEALLKLLIARREAAGLTQTDLGKRLGETQSFISKCERGERRLDVIELRMWCEALGLSLDKFVRDLEKACSAIVK